MSIRYKEEIVIPASGMYKALNSVADSANHRLNGIVKKYMANRMMPQKEPIEFPAKYKRRVDIFREDYDNRPVYTLIPKGRIVSDREMVFLHGGGGVMVPTALHFDTAVSLVETSGIPMNFLMYPLAPKVNCAEAVDWLEGWYENRVRKSPDKKYYVIGDSAGAGLATALCNGCRDNIAGVILISPAAGLDEKEKFMSDYEEHDILLSMELMNNIANTWGKGVEMTDWRINSSYVDFRGFPKTMIIYGGREMFTGIMPALIDKMTAAGVDLTVCKGEIHCHDWALARKLPEGKRVLKLMCDFASDFGM